MDVCSYEFPIVKGLDKLKVFGTFCSEEFPVVKGLD